MGHTDPPHPPHRAVGTKFILERRTHEPFITIMRSICTIEGCEKHVHGHGLCVFHWSRRRHGKPFDAPIRRRDNLSLDAILAFELDRCTWVGGCLVAPEPLNHNGYRASQFQGKRFLVHRVILARKLGRELRPKEVTRHTCHRRACLNPGHLLVGSHKGNTHDMIRAGRHTALKLRGEAKGGAKLCDDDVREIRRRYGQGSTSYLKLAKVYGVSKTTIERIVQGKRWVHLLDSWQNHPSRRKMRQWAGYMRAEMDRMRQRHHYLLSLHTGESPIISSQQQRRRELEQNTGAAERVRAGAQALLFDTP